MPPPAQGAVLRPAPRPAPFAPVLAAPRLAKPVDGVAPPPSGTRGDEDRFVLPDDHPYLANLAALWDTDPALARQLEAGDERAEIAGDLTVAGPDGTRGPRLRLHDPADPAAEARGLAAAVDPETHFALYVHGFGLGHHVRALLARTGGEGGSAPIAVFEPDVAMLRAALWHHDLSEVLGQRRVMIFTAADSGAVYEKLGALGPVIALGLGAVTLGASRALHGAFFDRVDATMADIAETARTHAATTLLVGRRTAENVTGNLALYGASPDLAQLAGAYAGHTAILVSAGPSLRKNIDQIRAAAGRAVIVAVQTALLPLLEAGIEPHYVTSLDYSEVGTRFFEKLPAGLRSQLVAEPKASPKVLAAWRARGGQAWINGNAFAEGVLREMNLRRCTLPPGATVAHLAFYVAEHLGCSTCLLVGQDLGFSDGLSYVPGTGYDDAWRPETGRFCSFETKQWEHIIRDKRILKQLPDWHGRPTYTEGRLFVYLQQFERMFASTRMKVIDATEGGVRKEGAEPMPLAEAIAAHCTRDVPPPPAFPQMPDVGEAVRDCLRRRGEEARQIAQVAASVLPLLEKIKAAGGRASVINPLIAEVDGLRRRMTAFDATYDLVVQVSQQSEQDRFRADLRIAAAGVDGAARQRRQVERDIVNVRAILKAAEDFAAMMERSA